MSRRVGTHCGDTGPTPRPGAAQHRSVSPKRGMPRALVHIAVAALVVAGVVAAGSASYASSSSPTDVITVKAGDTLWGIATARGISVAQLAAANQMSPSDWLLIGRRLVIPTPVSTRPATVAATTTPTEAAPPPAAAPNKDFCATTAFALNPYGELPSALADDPARLALRPTMAGWAEHYGVAPALVEAIAWQESGWQQGVVSPADAIGVGQLLPSTASFVNNDLLGTNLNVHVTNENIRLESAFLAYLIRQVGNNPCKVAAAYYQGPAALAAYGVFPESEQYVRDVLALEPQFS